MGIVLISPKRITTKKSLKLGFPAINNEAEYEALLVWMAMVSKLGGKVIEIFSDSRLVVGQVNGEFVARDQRMQGYLCKVRQTQFNFKAFSIRQIPKGLNSHADLLAMLATSLGLGLPQVIIVEDMMVFDHSDQTPNRIHSVQVGTSWMDPLVSFLRNGSLLKDKGEADKIRRKTPWYSLFEE